GFVLGKASANEQRLIDDCIDEASRSIDTLMVDGWGTALQRLHSYRPEQKG
ncbi:MAG: aminoacyl-tRNA hydrolase, partial [Idiomarina sp.]|nr:aminoacyl-tRNA hydrolase [Idiomarina sp.]